MIESSLDMSSWETLVNVAVSRWSLIEVAGVFALVVARMAGLVLVLIPLKGTAITWRTRLAAVVVLSLVTLPVLATGSRLSAMSLPTETLGWAVRALIEAGVGAILGLGVVVVIAGLRGAGEVIDRQTGWGLAGVLDPGSAETATPGTRLIVWTAVAVLFVMDPVDGHLLIVSSLLESLEAVPVADGAMLLAAGDLAIRLVHQSMLLAVQVVAPVLALMSLVTLATGIIGRSMPETNLLVAAMPARVLVSLLVLGLAVSGAARSVVDAVPAVLEQVGDSLVSVATG